MAKNNAILRPADLGSVSSGTLRTEDLLSALSSELDFQMGRQARRWPRADHRKLVREADAALRATKMPEDADELVSDLFDALDEYAPPLAYFGAHEGDGADYGYWISDEAIRYETECGSVKATDDPHGDPFPGMVLFVNDHGNMALYGPPRGKRRERTVIWDIV